MAKFAHAVTAFEPNTALIEHLRRLLGAHVRIESVALSNVPGTTTLRYVASNTGVATIESRNDLGMIADRSQIVTTAVEKRTLDSYGYSDVSFIKIDVEGHEEAVIEGAQCTLARCRPTLLIESENRHNLGAPRRLAATLAALNYAGFYLRQGWLYPVAAISDDDRDAANLAIAGKRYINNYFFLPEENLELISHIRVERPT